jgi:hypothetical protein
LETKDLRWWVVPEQRWEKSTGSEDRGARIELQLWHSVMK